MSNNPITAIEFGTDKICVLHGRRDQAGNTEILAFAQAPSADAVRKGIIVDYNRAQRILGEVLERADRSLAEPIRGSDRRSVYSLIGGVSVTSRRGEGSVRIYNGDRVGIQHEREALEKAHQLALPQGIVSFNSFDESFVINRNNRVKDPTGQLADQLDAYVHIVTAEQARIERLRDLIRDLGFERPVMPVFSAVASAFGVLRADEQEQGVLLADLGLGVCGYSLVREEGVYLSGVLPVGVANIANDLSVGLDLPYDFCLRFLREHRMTRLRKDGASHLDYVVPATGGRRRIPLDSFEKIMTLRLREIFTILKQIVKDKKLSYCMTCGAVLTGGGALIEGAPDTMKSVFSAPVRVGEPVGVSGVKASFDSAPVCYASILGLLKYGIDNETARDAGGMDLVVDKLAGVTEWVSRLLRKGGVK